jgi:outer membrane lipoprotein-sorting protein
MKSFRALIINSAKRKSLSLTAESFSSPKRSFTHFSGLSVLLLILLLSFVLPLVLSGCLASTSRKKPVEDLLAADGPAMELANSLRQAGQDISTLAARGSVEYTADKSNHFFRFEVLAKKPDSFQFTILDPLGRPAVRMVNDGFQFMALEYGPREASIGDSQTLSLGRFLPVGLTAQDFISILSATLVPDPSQASFSLNSAEKIALRIVPEGHWSGSTWRVDVSTGENSQRIDGFSANFENGLPILAAYSNFTSHPVEDINKIVDFPSRIDLTWGQGEKLLIRYTEVRLGFPAQSEMFSTSVPSGFKQTEL